MFTTLRCSVVVAALTLCLAVPALAQYQTPDVNGTIAEGEYAHSSGDWSMTWDATYLYIAKANVTSGNGLVIYLDADPMPTPAAGTNANGNLNGQSDQWMSSITGFAPDLPFRGDARSLTGVGIAELRTRDGSGGWTNVSTAGADVTTVVGTDHEVRIRWGAMLGSLSAPPASFNWLGFEIRDAAGMTEGINTMPSANPGVGNSRMPYLLTVANTSNGTSSDPFATVQSTWKVVMNNDSGIGSLRQAITNAEADGTSSRRFISFGGPVSIIQLTSDLPVITKTTTIDGTSHQNWTADPVVVLESAGATTTGIELSAAANSVVRGLDITNAFTNPVKVTGGSGNTIAGNWIGLTGTGSPANSIVLNGTTNCTIGGTATADRNVIAHASGSGIFITGSSGTQVLNNYIGTDQTGLSGAGNHAGISVHGTSGGTVIGSAANGNVISSNDTDGIAANSSVTILGNKIGAAADGTALGNGGTGVSLDASNTPIGSIITIGTIAAPNVIRTNQNGGIAGSSGGFLSIRGNSIFENLSAGIDLSGVVQPTPTISSATIDGSGLTITVSAASGGSTQSLRLDLYDADPFDLSIIQPKTYRATSPCYASSSLSNTSWNVGSGYAPGDKLVLMITSYMNDSCTVIGKGTSEPSAVITPIAVTTTTLVSAPVLYATPNQSVTLTATVSSAVAGVSGNVSFTANGNPIAGCTSVAVSSNQAQCPASFASFGTYTLGATYAGTATHAASAATPIELTVARIFNGPGNFSTTSLWTDSNAPQSNEAFVIKGACTFDSAAPARAYGAMTLAANASVTWTTNHTTALTVTDINGAGTNTIDMTGGGLLRFSGTYDTSDVTLTRGLGTVVLSGVSQEVPLLTYNNLTIVGTTTLPGTLTVHGALDVVVTASLTGGTIEMRGPSIADAGTLSVANLTIPSGVTTSTSSSFGVTDTMTVDGTFSPSASAVITGGATLTGTGTLKVTGTDATNSLAGQYAFVTKVATALSVEYLGSAAQRVDTLPYGNLTIDNPSGVTTAGASIGGVLTLTSGVVTGTAFGSTLALTSTSPSALVTGSGRLGAMISLRRSIAAGTSSYSFPVGVAAGSAPVTITVHSAPAAGLITVSPFTPADISAADSGIDTARDANLFWRIDVDLDAATMLDVTLNFAGFADAGASPLTFVCRRSNGGLSNWTATSATSAPASITLNNISRGSATINWFTAGNQRIDHYAITAASPQTAGVAFTTTVTAQDKLNVTVSDTTRVVTMSSNQGNAEFDSDGNGTFGDVTKPLTAGTFTISTRDTTPELLQIRATDTSAATGTSSGITVNPAADAPASLVATAVSASQINLSWPAASGATSYEIWRSSLNSSYTLVNTTSSTAYSDSGLTANRTYLYKVRAVGGTTFSPTDVATTIVFTDPALTGVAVKAVHITELRTAADAMRAAGGLTAGTYTSISAGSTIARIHITQLRAALDAARAALGLPALTYTDPTITVQSTKIKAAHVEELRAGTQ